jgi:hypothetical protein
VQRCGILCPLSLSFRVQVGKSDGAICEAITQREVEDAIWNEIHGKRFYLAEQAPIYQGKLRGDFGYMANTEEAREVLPGTYVCPEGQREQILELLICFRR